MGMQSRNGQARDGAVRLRGWVGRVGIDELSGASVWSSVPQKVVNVKLGRTLVAQFHVIKSLRMSAG